MTFVWSGPDGFTAATKDISGLKAGQYTLVIIDENMCTTRESFKLTEPDPIGIAFDVTDPSCPEKPDGEISLTVTGGISDHNYTYRWSDNSNQANISNIPAGLYKVTVTDINGCSVDDFVQLNGLNKTCLIIPEAFSPNKDLINDVWILGNADLYPQMEITIYNRWGQVVWKSQRGYPIPWDGMSRGLDLPIDSYHYIIDLHNELQPVVGTITIIR
jgi:gliding motility-associated-like protein